MDKITPFLWFDNQPGEAMDFYTSIFKNSKPGKVVRWGKAGPGVEGTVMSATFELEGREFHAFNGGPDFKFTHAISFMVDCETQEEVDYFWEKLSAGGEVIQCGWLRDKFGLSWQIVPAVLFKLLNHEDQEKAGRAMQAMMKMTRLDIKALQAAFDGAE